MKSFSDFLIVIGGVSVGLTLIAWVLRKTDSFAIHELVLASVLLILVLLGRRYDKNKRAKSADEFGKNEKENRPV